MAARSWDAPEDTGSSVKEPFRVSDIYGEIMRTGASISAVFAFLFLCPQASAAQDRASWIRYSDAGDNLLIVEMIEQGDLAVGLEAAAALGRREDFRVGAIILALGQSSDPRPDWERELVLRTLLHSVFPSSLGGLELERRLQANREGFDYLVSGLPGFGLPLKREILRLLAYLHPPEYLGALMSEGRRLAEVLPSQAGMLNGEQAGLAITYLDTVGAIAQPEFADIVLLILERSRHLEVAQKARTVSRILLLGR
jgi:hypothetical protein